MPSASKTANSAHSRPRSRSKQRLRWLALCLTVLVLVAALAALYLAGWMPRDVARYVERRSAGHAPWISQSGARLAQTLNWLDRHAALAARSPHAPDWLGAQVAASGSAPPALRAVLVASVPDLQRALSEALPGDVISLLPGDYLLSQTLVAQRPGSAEAPIVLRAPALGNAVLRVQSPEGIRVRAPYWRFENLELAGCAGCDNAFHIVGAASHTVLRNNRLRDFNAHIKINGEDGRFPDGGQLLGNSLFNSAARATSLSVVAIDLVAANDWQIEKNLIADILKSGGDMTSYGAYAKGGGQGNVFAGNLVMCERGLSPPAGRSVGLSLGGGGTEARFCRDGQCLVEQQSGVLINNIILNCSDRGVYLNRAADSRLIHNSILDTAGISVRYPESSLHALGNLVDAPIQLRDGGLLLEQSGIYSAALWAYLGWHPAQGHYRAPFALDFAWREGAPKAAALAQRQHDICGAKVSSRAPALGAIEDFTQCRAP